MRSRPPAFLAVLLFVACAHAPRAAPADWPEEALREAAFRALLAQPGVLGEEETAGADPLRCLGAYRDGVPVDVSEDLLRRLEDGHRVLRPLSACQRGPGWLSTFRSARKYVLLTWSPLEVNHALVTAGYATGDEFPEEHPVQIDLRKTSAGWQVTSVTELRHVCL